MSRHVRIALERSIFILLLRNLANEVPSSRISSVAVTWFLAAFLSIMVLPKPTALAQGNERDAGRLTEFSLTFDAGSAGPSWDAENDSVMGGVSKGAAEINNGVLRFHGFLSLENNGGFAQVGIQDLGLDLRDKAGMKLRVRGDGRTYEFRLATNARYRGSRIAYSVEFPTKAGEWSDVFVRFSDLKASHHGNALDGPPADLSQVEEMSFLLGDGKEGPFELEVDAMTAE